MRTVEWCIHWYRRREQCVQWCGVYIGIGEENSAYSGVVYTLV